MLIGVLDFRTTEINSGLTTVLLSIWTPQSPYDSVISTRKLAEVTSFYKAFEHLFKEKHFLYVVLHAASSEAVPLDESEAQTPGSLLWHKMYKRDSHHSNGNAGETTERASMGILHDVPADH